jgi:hypothetical protein
MFILGIYEIHYPHRPLTMLHPMHLSLMHSSPLALHLHITSIWYERCGLVGGNKVEMGWDGGCSCEEGEEHATKVFSKSLTSVETYCMVVIGKCLNSLQNTIW